MAITGLDKTTPTNSDDPSSGDDEFRALKLFLQSFFTFSDATNITNAPMSVSDAGAVVINDTGVDLDFRIEGANNANMIVVDAGQDAISFGGANVDGAAAIFNNLQQRTFVTVVGSQIHVPAQTTDFDNTSGTIAVGSAVFLGAPDWTNANATLTITDAATLVVALPTAGSQVTFTNLAHTIHALGAVWIETGSAGAITAEITADDLVVENSGAVGISLLSDTGDCDIHFGDTEDADIGQIRYIHSTNVLSFVAGAATVLSLGEATPGQVHVAPSGTADAELEVSDGSSIGAGDVHRAAATTHSSRHMKDIVRYYTAADERRCYDDVKSLKPMRFIYRKGADPHDPTKPGNPNPTGRRHNGYFLDEAPDFIKAAPRVHGIVIDDRIMMLEMALKETIRKVEAGSPGPP